MPSVDGLESNAPNAQDTADSRLLQSFFSDETEAFRSPAEPELGQYVTIRMRVEKQIDAHVCLAVGANSSLVPMNVIRTDELFTWYEATIRCGLEPLRYLFLIECAEGNVLYQKGGAQRTDEVDDSIDPSLDFRIIPGFHVPTWAKGVVQYQIFPDRFANGDSRNDVVDGEYSYNGQHVRHAAEWDALPTNDDYRCFYGGDLQGVASKLDYLQSLGVEAIYLNPIFISPSSHKYDTQDYWHVDPHFAIIRDDIDQPLSKGALDNREAHRYIKRTTSPENLKRSNDFFASLCGEIHKRGMRIILDGVFNHCGSFNKWMDYEGIYEAAGTDQPGAYRSPDSPYRHYFNFDTEFPLDYEGWWNFPTLPKLNYEQAPDLADRIIELACMWAQPPYCIDGWRLDVAADLGHSEEYNHGFWRRFRSALKAVNPELVIIAEHYGNPSAWVRGGQWDTVMNYDAFMDPLTYFLTGMEKHSDRKDDELYQDGERFCHAMRSNMARFEWGSLLCAMNELSNHDHSRFLTRTNRTVGRLDSAGSVAAGEGVDKRVLREAVAVQMTWPGAPTIYYADEAGQVGWTDPDCRRTYPWGNEDEGLIQLHRELASIRSKHTSLRTGSFVSLGGGRGWIAFGRFDADDRMVTACNNADFDQTISLHLRLLGASDTCKVVSCLSTTENGFDLSPKELGTVDRGMCKLTIPARTAIVASIDSER